MSQAREPAGRELLIERGYAEQPVLQPVAFGAGGSAAKDLETRVDLDRVAGDRDWVLPALAQEIGGLYRDARLADRGGPEYGQHPHRAPIVVPPEEDE